jgi:hypothetical protein
MMKSWIIYGFVLWLVSAAPLVAQTVKTKLYSSFLARGEKALMELIVEGGEPDDMPIVPKIQGVEIELIGNGPGEMVPGKNIDYRFQYVFTSYAVGSHTIPDFEISVGGQMIKSGTSEFEVFNPDSLTWKEAVSTPEVAGQKFRYASMIKVSDQKIFQYQTIPTEIKIYVPRNMMNSVLDWGVPEFDREGLAVWRYEASDARGEVNLLGQPYVAISYWSTLSPLRSGEVTIGPAKVRLTYVDIYFDGGTRRVQLEANLEVTDYKFQVQALPDGAPKDFDGAVGQFNLSTIIQKTEVVEGEPISLDVKVRGSGNLDKLSSPKMIDPTGWRVYDATPKQRGEERRELSGEVAFSQFIRPLEMKTTVPGFSMVYFDPKDETYKIASSEPIVISMTPMSGRPTLQTAGPPQALPIPIERMTDILGVIPTDSLLKPNARPFPHHVVQIVLGMVAFVLMVKALWMRYAHLLESDPKKLEMKKDFQKVLNSGSSDGLAFLKIVGGFAEKWLNDRNMPEVREVLEERDRLCFQKDKQDVVIPSNRRQQIMRTLKRVAFGLILLGFILPQVQAGDIAIRAKQLYETGKYEDAAKVWLGAGPYPDLSADTLYNIGNAAYRMGSVGEAALFYRRALSRDAGHAEARQNLRFIERKHGSITVERPAYQYALAKVPFDVWRGGFLLGGWILLLSFLVFFATRPGSPWRVSGVSGLILAPLMISLGALGCYYYPNDAQFAPLATQAVIVGDKVVLHTDAARTSPEVIDAPPGSLAEIIYESGRWAYVGFAKKTRGWVPIESLEKIIPDKSPSPPKLRKTTADGSSA